MMAERRMTGSNSWILLLLVLKATAIPQVAFPFNSQVPTVPRTNQPYTFQFSASTFTPSAEDVTYSLSGQPQWLTLDSATRTLSGTPLDGDTGPASFMLSAADQVGTAQMHCTLVVSADPPPQLAGDISQQLAESANLSSSSPAVVTLLPDTAFRFVFQHSSFIDIVQRKLYYYATLADRTPLPAWLRFDSSSGDLVFTGTAQPLAAYPQSFNISLIASDVAGFGAASAYFTIMIGARQLVFVPDDQDFNIESGGLVNISSLQDELYLNGMAFPVSNLREANASLPKWLTFDPATLSIVGQAPPNLGDSNGSITVTDEIGDTATVNLHFTSSNTTLIHGSIGILKAYIGQPFDYKIPHSVVDATTVELGMDLPGSASWLTFDASSAELKGTVPKSATATVIEATLTAQIPGTATQFQRFGIDVQAGVSTTSGTSQATDLASRTIPSETSTSSGNMVSTSKSRDGLAKGVIAAIVISSIVGATLFVVLLIFCCRCRRRRQDSWVHFLPSASQTQTTLPRREISGPMRNPMLEGIMVRTELQRDVEKAPDSPTSASGTASTDMTEADKAPQIALTIPRHSAKGSKWNARLSRISQASSIGDGEEAIKGDSNIPEWGRESDVVNRTAHHSFSLPAEMARASRQVSQRSTRKAEIRRARGKKRLEEAAEQEGSSKREGSIVTRSSRGRRHKPRQSSSGLAATMDRSSFTSSSTRGTSVLSTRPSDFPRPPSESICPAQSSATRLSWLNLDKRRSIRLVDRSDSVRDTRSMAEKRQSFIRNRASTSLQSPLFAHGSRVPSVKKESSSRSTSRNDYSNGHSRTGTGESQLRVDSESSFVLEPPPRDPRRLSARVKSTFAPNFPRAITQTTLGAGDETALTEQNSRSSGFYTTSSSVSQEDIAAQMALPRHQRSWVLPGEASPTPPPRPLEWQPRTKQDTDHTVPLTAREKLKKRLNRDSKGQLCEYSSSPLSSHVFSQEDHKQGSRGRSAGASTSRSRNRLSEPLSLVSTDSLTHARGVHMRLLRAASAKRPISVDVGERLRSLKAEPDTDTQAGSEVWESAEGGSVNSEAPRSLRRRDRSEGLSRNSSSGPVFI